MAIPSPHPTGYRALFWIGVFKLVKGTLLLIFAFGVLGFLHRDVATIAEHLVRVLHFDSDNRHIASLLQKAGLITDKRIEELSGLTFFYAGIFLTEGIGLMLRKRWAEYLTVIAGGSLIPVEIYALFKHVVLMKIVLLGVNVGIVWFLIRLLRKTSAAEAPPSAAPQEQEREPAEERA